MFAFVISVLYTLAGISAFIVFLIYGNYPTAVWAIITAIITAINGHLHWLKLRKVLNQWYERKELTPIYYIGFVCFTLGLMGTGYHSTIEIMLKKPMMPINQSEVTAIVWAFLTARGGLCVMFTIRSFSRQQADDEEPCIVQPTSNDSLNTVD
ncbi:hypothetical protein PPYR_01621 [Photinus pyralis]|uniref:Uncharacterized protein n=1 Tax=Photinus pyralis TaxID=7054 RepID=A0A5N4B4V7_PHOPY|nr:uncharacterized protein LOC116160642 [Photinus pyralis]KAB0804651.1 hypothetical protein PPYR_01621 [Photinus pyralis]